MTVENCQHKRKSRLKGHTKDGVVIETDWQWCAICGSVKAINSRKWFVPEIVAKAALFDLLMDGLPDSSTDHISWMDWKIEIPKYGQPTQYLANWVEEYKHQQQLKAGK